MAHFITFEGIEGCGKTTQIRLLAEALKKSGHRVVQTREPGGCAISDKIRAILLDAENSAMTPLAELLLYAAARAQHVAEIIAPSLSRGETVLCDRFTDATIAYQGNGRGLEMRTILDLNETATNGCRPDLTILIDCPVDTGLKRAMARIEAGSSANAGSQREERFELESRQFHQRVRDGYLALAKENPHRFIVVDGSNGIEETAALIADAVATRAGL